MLSAYYDNRPIGSKLGVCSLSLLTTVYIYILYGWMDGCKYLCYVLESLVIRGGAVVGRDGVERRGIVGVSEGAGVLGEDDIIFVTGGSVICGVISG